MNRDELASQIRRCQQGRRDGFDWLVREFGPPLYRYFVRLTASTNDAEDLVQDVFVKLLKNIKGYRHENKFEHWLFRIAANLARDRIRKRMRHGTPISLDSQTADFESSIILPSDDTDPTAPLEQHELEDDLQKALKQLPQLDREMIIMRHYSDLSFKEIAEQFNLPLGTALAKVHRGLKRLKKLMSGPNEK